MCFKMRQIPSLGVFTYIQGILICVEDESGVDDLARQREYIEGSMNEVVPAPGDIQAAQLIVAARLILD